MTIRNFIYLDSQKLRSVSSQLFEGVADSVLHSEKRRTEKVEQQKGSIASGRLLGDIFSKENSSSELKFLEDHAFTLLEDKLIGSGSVDQYRGDVNNLVTTKSFVKVTGPLSMNDTAITASTLKNFNDIGQSQWRAVHEHNQNEKSLGDTEAKKKAREMGLQMNQKWADALAYLVEFGFGGLLEFNVQIGKTLFSAPIKRDFLRESERMLLHKYSRVTQRKFSILGIVTQQYQNATVNTELPDVRDAAGIKTAMRILALHLRTLEQLYSGPSEGEIIIDPIAVYSEI